LLEALHKGDAAEVERLLASPEAPRLLAARNTKGCTPLMLAAMGCCSEALLEKMLGRGASIVGAALRSANGRTAADYATLHKVCPRLRAALKAAEEVVLDDGIVGCCVCGARLRQHTKLSKLDGRCRLRKESCSFLVDFVSENPRVVRKLSESNFHVVDLCCGKSLTSALAALRHPGCLVTAVDRLPHRKLPHYAEAGLGGSVKYSRLDVLAPGFLPTLADMIARIDRPTAVLGMHLCGRLSEQAAMLFRRCERAALCVLSPCCLPPLEDAPVSLRPLYRTGDQLRSTGLRNKAFKPVDEQQYHAWCDHLRRLLQESGIGDIDGAGLGVEVRGTQAPDMFSIKRTMLVALKSPREGNGKRGEDCSKG